MEKWNGIIAIDFDDTIVKTDWPKITGLMPFAKDVIHVLKERGWFIIINTCRSGGAESEAVNFLIENDIPFDLINENHPDLIEYFGIDCRKISADVYVDDKNYGQIGRPVNWYSIFRQVKGAEFYIEPLLSKFYKSKA